MAVLRPLRLTGLARLAPSLLLLLLPLVHAAPSSPQDAMPAVPVPQAAADNEVGRAGHGLGSGLAFLELARGYQRLGKKMILPLLVGVLLKVASFVPLILGKLSLLAIVSIVASKLALLISAIVGTKKLYASGMPYSHQSHHHGDWEGAASSLSGLSLADLGGHYNTHLHRATSSSMGRSLRSGASTSTPAWEQAPLPTPPGASVVSSETITRSSLRSAGSLTAPDAVSTPSSSSNTSIKARRRRRA